MASFSPTLMFCWRLIYFLLRKLIIPFFIDGIYWLSLSQWYCARWNNERFLSCLKISVLSCVSRKFLQSQNKSSVNLSLLYPGVRKKKFKPFSKTDFTDGESRFSDMLNMIESKKILFVCNGVLINSRSSWMLLPFKFLIFVYSRCWVTY